MGVSKSVLALGFAELVSDLADTIGDEGWYDVKQLRPLTNAERALIIDANPDVLNRFRFEPDEVAAIFRGDVSPAMWLSSISEGALRGCLFEAVVDHWNRAQEHLRNDGEAPEPYLEAL